MSTRAAYPPRGARACEILGGVRWRSFVAVGDSFTEGLDDPSPDGAGYRGWADLVAARLAHLARTGPDPGQRFGYANLAIRGRLFAAVADEQVPVAAAMRPDLVSFAAGGNDVLRRRFDGPALVERFGEVVGSLRTGGADVIVFRFADVTGRLPGRRMIRPRMQVLNEAVGQVAQRHGAILVDLWLDHEFHNPRLWSEDRLHLGPAGHHRVAAHVLSALGLTPQPAWLATPPPGPRPGWVTARIHDARWAGQHLAPWVRRRISGRSSGDTVSAKRPTLAPL
jgi:lysophospholipase L1-like esterase